jgi:hypothetical protein
MAAMFDLSTDTLKVALGNNNTAYTFDPVNHTFVADVFDGGTTAEEFGTGTGTGYSRQGMTNQSVTQDDTDNEGVFDADDVTFAGLDGADIQFIMVYKQVGGDDTTPGDDLIVNIYDDDSAGSLADLPLTTNGSDVTISWDTEGITNIGN